MAATSITHIPSSLLHDLGSGTVVLDLATTFHVQHSTFEPTSYCRCHMSQCCRVLGKQC